MNTFVISRGLVVSFVVFICCAFAFAIAPSVGSAHGSDHASHATSTATSTRGTGKARNVDATCMSAAIDTRETALMTAWDELSTSIKTGLTDRKSALSAAWALTDLKARNAGIVAAWKEWRTDKKAAHTEFRKDRKSAWEAFKKTAKDSCKMSTPKDESLEKASSDAVAI
jgi:hypothetical protein